MEGNVNRNLEFKVLQDEINQTREYLNQAFQVMEYQAKAMQALAARIEVLEKANKPVDKPLELG